MDLSAIIKAVLDPVVGHSESAVKQLRSGDRLTGKVLKLVSDGRVLMDFGNFRAHTNISWPVRQGHKLNLEVVETGLQLKLRILPESNGSRKVSMPHLDFTQALSSDDQNRLMVLMERMLKSSQPVRLSRQIVDAFTQLKAAFQPLQIGGVQNLDDLVHRLRHRIEDGGLLLEKKLAETQASEIKTQAVPGKTSGGQARTVLNQDLKAQLLLLKSFLSEIKAKPDGPTAIADKELLFMRRTVEQLLVHIQDQQGRVMSRMGDNEQIVIINHHLYLENHREPVHIKLFYPKKTHRKQRPGQYRLAMLLNMDRLGPVRIDMAMLEDALEVGFFVKSESVRSALEAHRDQIVTALQEGFQQVLMVVRISHEKIARFQSQDRADPAFGRIDIQI